MARMQDKVVVVTGAAQGIGAAIAQRFADEGATLVLLDTDAERLKQTAAATGKSPATWVIDVTEEAAVDNAFARIEADHGRVDVLVNNVGGARNARLWEMSAADWDFTIRLNLRSAFLCTRAGARLMMKRRAGAIVCMSSGSREGTPWTAHHSGGAAYSAAKAGIHGFIRDAALELAEHGIRINAVAPGPIDTGMLTRFTGTPERKAGLVTTVPMDRLGLAEEVANAIVFIASDEASFITGHVLNVDGGKSH
jgi:NAD(P)-dependent dehydrogenase (short-subunit alcohol dehydrogenase family)